LNFKQHAVCDGNGRPVIMLVSEGPMSDYKGARLTVESLPPAKHLLADQGYNADWFGEALWDKVIEPHIPPRKSRTRKIEYVTVLYS